MKDVTKKDIIEGLKKLGIKEGDVLFVHSSLSRFGHVEKGATTVIDALTEVVGKKGTLALPSFPAFVGGEYGIAKAEIVFDVRTSPTAMGIIPQTFWQLPGVKRSLHSTHSVAIMGKEMDWLIEGHEKCTCSCGRGTPFYKLCQAKGKILLLGVTHSSNTTLHTVEDCHGAPTRSTEIFYPKVINYEGEAIAVPLHPHLPGLSRDYEKMDKICKEKGIQKEVKIGNSLCKLIDAYSLFKIGGDYVKKDLLFLIKTETYKKM